MTKNIRVYELARELDVKSKEVLRILQGELNLDIQNHMSTINDNVARRVKELLRGEAPAPQPPAGEDSKREKRSSKASARKPAPNVAKGSASQTVAPDPVPGSEKEPPKRRHGKGGAPDHQPERAHAPEPRKITLSGPISVGELANKLGVRPVEAVQKLMGIGIMASLSQELDLESAIKLAEMFGAAVETEEADRLPDREAELLQEMAPDRPEDLLPRGPVVTVLGHVDHGKTTLLDTIRKTETARNEAGGITQHIGASLVHVDGKPIVFLDTPGHEAFTELRARGARVTDIAVLVVAADDGVMPQTVEAINHARAANVPIIVAINKVDKPEANLNRVYQELTEHGLVPEEWGGDTICVPVSALRGDGIEDLLEMILLVAEIAELKANPNRPAVGTVLESRLDRGRGPVATVLIQEGTLKQGDAFVSGATWGRVRAMLDDRGRQRSEAGPATPVEVLGFQDVPQAGDRVIVVSSEKEARDLAERRQTEIRDEEFRASRALNLWEFSRKTSGSEHADLPLVLKADVQGSLEAIRNALERLGSEEVRVRILHGGVGAITESDVMLASTAGAIVLGFNVRPDAKARRAAEAARVEIRTYRVIYELIDGVRRALEGLLTPDVEEWVIGQAEVRAIFQVPGTGTVAGCFVSEGVVRRNARVRLLRDGTIVYEGRIESLKRFKDDVREVRAGYECGISLERFQDIKEGDILEILEEREVRRTLEG